MDQKRLSASLWKIVEALLGNYVEAFAALLGAIGSILDVPVPKLPWEPKPTPIDERLAKLELAKAALAESLGAIEELQKEAEMRKHEHTRVLADLASTLASKDDAEKKFNSIKALMSQDVEAFRALAGVADVRRERLIGFGSGVVASIIASVVFTIAAALIRRAGWIT